MKDGDNPQDRTAIVQKHDDSTRVAHADSVGSPTTLLGQTASGRYRLERLLDRRGNDAIFLATHLGTPYSVSLTVVTDGPRDASGSARFRETLRILMELRHPNVVRMLDYGYLDDGTPYYVEELHHGESLFRRLQDGPLTAAQVVAVLRDCAEGLRHAHRYGSIHAALTPSNVVLPERPTAVTARIRNFTAHARRHFESPCDIAEPRVAAPEVLRGEEPSPAADVYALGHLAAACVMGNLLASMTDPVPLHLSDTPWTLGEQPQFPRQLIELIETCLQKDTGRRFSTPGDVLRALDRLAVDLADADGGTEPPELPRTGGTLNGRYLLERVLGKGGFSRVFRARDQSDGAVVAVKILHTHLADTNERRRFEREGEVLFTHLESPHTLRVIDYGVSTEGLCFIATEFVDGLTLEELLEREGAQPAARTRAILLQVLESLAEAHRLQVFHRDLKPANIMVSPRSYNWTRGEVPNCWATVLDFGVASMQGELQDATSLTATGTAVGTPRYMAPEQLFGHTVGPETDIYSLGLIAFELLTGDKAIKGNSTGELVTNQVSAQSAILAPTADVPIDLAMIVNKMVRKDRSTRFQNCRDVTKALLQLDLEPV